jgi:hypothetical protein
MSDCASRVIVIPGISIFIGATSIGTEGLWIIAFQTAIISPPAAENCVGVINYFASFLYQNVSLKGRYDLYHIFLSTL